MSHQCYYCDQMFDSKERLFDHLEVHADTVEKQSKKSRKASASSVKSQG